MAIFFKLTTILSLTFLLVLQACNSSPMASTLADNIDHQDEEEIEEYVLDDPVPNLRSRSRFLGSVIKKGTHCNAMKYNVCNGVWANKGKSLLHCCKSHCRNVLGDKNNCGRCGNKCKFGERCCNGSCTNVLSNANHCGKCDRKCKAGVGCQYGFCGYA